MDCETQPSTVLASSPSSGDNGDADFEQAADAFAPLRALLESEDSDAERQPKDADTESCLPGEASRDELDWYRCCGEDSPECEAEDDEAEEEGEEEENDTDPVVANEGQKAAAAVGLSASPSSARPMDLAGAACISGVASADETPALPTFAMHLGLKDQSNGVHKKLKKDKKEKKQKKRAEKANQKPSAQPEVDAPTPCHIPVPVPSVHEQSGSCQDQHDATIKRPKKDKKDKKQKRNAERADEKERKRKKPKADAPTPCVVPGDVVPEPTRGRDPIIEGTSVPDKGDSVAMDTEDQQPAQQMCAEAEVASAVDPVGTAEDELVFAGGLRNVPMPLEGGAEEELDEPSEPTKVVDEAVVEGAAPAELVFAEGLRNAPMPEIDADVIAVDSDDSPTAEDASALFEALAATSATGPVVEVLRPADTNPKSAAAKLVPQLDPTSSVHNPKEADGLLGNASMLDDFASPLEKFVNEDLVIGESLHAAEASPAEPSEVLGNASMFDDFAGNSSMLDDYVAAAGGDESPVTPPDEVEVPFSKAAAVQSGQQLSGYATPHMGNVVRASAAAAPTSTSKPGTPTSKSGLQAKKAALALPPNVPLVSQQPLPPALALLPPLSPPPPPPTRPPELALMQPQTAVQQLPNLGVAPPAAMPKWQGTGPEVAPSTLVGTSSDDLPVNMSSGTIGEIPTQPITTNASDVEPLQISIGTPLEATGKASVGDGVVEIADEEDDEDDLSDPESASPSKGSMLLEVLQSILPAPDNGSQADENLQA